MPPFPEEQSNASGCHRQTYEHTSSQFGLFLAFRPSIGQGLWFHLVVTFNLESKQGRGVMPLTTYISGTVAADLSSSVGTDLVGRRQIRLFRRRGWQDREGENGERFEFGCDQIPISRILDINVYRLTRVCGVESDRRPQSKSWHVGISELVSWQASCWSMQGSVQLV